MATLSALPCVPLLPQQEDDKSQARLTLSHLLNPDLWDLPEWNGPQ